MSPSRSAWPRAASSSAASAVTGLEMDPAWNSRSGGTPAAQLQAMLDSSMTATPSTLLDRRSNAVTDSPGECAEAGMVSSGMVAGFIRTGPIAARMPVIPAAWRETVTGPDRRGCRHW
jgi:hypothetical protein